VTAALALLLVLLEQWCRLHLLEPHAAAVAAVGFVVAFVAAVAALAVAGGTDDVQECHALLLASLFALE
jgi:hypothetical protein